MEKEELNSSKMAESVIDGSGITNITEVESLEDNAVADETVCTGILKLVLQIFRTNKYGWL